MSVRGKRSPYFKVDRIPPEMADYLFSLGFSSGEIMVLDAALDPGGLSNLEMGEKLFISHKTIKFHLGNIYKRFQIGGGRGTYKKTNLIIKLKNILEKEGYKLLKL